MLMALDYDETYTLDPYFWKDFIARAHARGHEVIIATMRFDKGPEADEVNKEIGNMCRIYFTSRKAKLGALKELGVEPDVWIDDNPLWIYEGG